LKTKRKHGKILHLKKAFAIFANMTAVPLLAVAVLISRILQGRYDMEMKGCPICLDEPESIISEKDYAGVKMALCSKCGARIYGDDIIIAIRAINRRYEKFLFMNSEIRWYKSHSKILEEEIDKQKKLINDLSLSFNNSSVDPEIPYGDKRLQKRFTV
jgi:hypothetical protein